MMSICPLCNGLFNFSLPCPQCGHAMIDQGILENYFGPYSPYLDEDILDQNDGVGPGQCIHLFVCPQCGFDIRQVIAHLTLPLS